MDDIKQLTSRFGRYLKGKDSGYFDVEELLILVHYYADKGDTEAVDEVALLASKLHPHSEDTIKIRAIAHLYKNEFEQSLQLLQHVHSNDMESLLIRLTTLLALNRLDEVKQLTDEILQDDSIEPDMLCDLSKCFVTTGHARLGLDFLKKCGKRYPNDSDILFLTGEFHEIIGNTRLAEKTYLKLIDDNPFDADAWFNLAQIYAQKEKYGSALDAINYSLAVDPHDPSALQLKADILTLTGRYKESIQILLDALKEGADAYDIYISIGKNYLVGDEYEKALEWFDKAENKKPNILRTLLHKFDALIGLQQLDQACQLLDIMAHNNVPLALIWERKGLIESLIGQYDNARKSYKRAVKGMPDNPFLWAKLSMVEWELGNYAGSKRYINKALDIDNGFLYGYMVLASTYFKLRQYKKMLDIIGSPIFSKDPHNVVFFELCPEMKPNFKKIIDALRNKKDIDDLLVYPAHTNE